MGTPANFETAATVAAGPLLYSAFIFSVEPLEARTMVSRGMETRVTVLCARSTRASMVTSEREPATPARLSDPMMTM